MSCDFKLIHFIWDFFFPVRFLHQYLKKVKSNTKICTPTNFQTWQRKEREKMADQAPWSDEKTASYVKRHMDDKTVVTEDLLFCLKEVSANLAVMLWGLSLQIWHLYSGQCVEKLKKELWFCTPGGSSSTHTKRAQRMCRVSIYLICDLTLGMILLYFCVFSVSCCHRYLPLVAKNS